MNLRKESEAFRNEMLLHLLAQNRGKPVEVAEAEKIVAKYREERAKIHDAIARLGSVLPEADACPQCYYLNGLTSIMVLITSNATGDIFRCEECVYTQHRYT
jgi:hypothetical protein